MKRFCYVLILCFTGFTLKAQDLVYAEYFIGHDPGVGNGTEMVFTADTAVEFITDISTTGLSPGFHTVFVRIKDENNNWSLYQGRTFHIQAPGASSQPSPYLLSGEYFFNEDPGIGNGTPITIPNDSAIDQTIDISTVGLEAGFHTCFIRLRDEAGQWSIYQGRTFHIQEAGSSTIPSPYLIGGEYFFNEDPGIGNGTPFTIPNDSAIDLNIDVSTVTLDPGFHTCFVRIEDEAGQWSIYQGRTFHIQPPGSSAQPSSEIVAAEYFVDNDPGAGNGTPIPVTQGDSVTGNLEIDMTGYGMGDYLIYFRLQDADGNWSIYQVDTFSVIDCDVPDIAATPTGNVEVCVGEIDTIYTTLKDSDTTTYEWRIVPTDAATITTSDTTAKLSWNETFIGIAALSVRGVNSCYWSSYSDELVITRAEIPDAPSVPDGDTALCTNPSDRVYTISAVNGATSYEWDIFPISAGEITGTSTSGTVNWEDTYSGDADITVRASNFCGDSEYSDSLFVVIREMPAMVALPEGDTTLCENPVNSDITTTGAAGTAEYEWNISPVEAGTISGSGTTCTVDWDDAFVDTAWITVRGINEECIGNYSEALQVVILAYPDKATQPEGDTALCQDTDNTEYVTSAVNASSYYWEILPVGAGAMSGTGTVATVDWDDSYIGVAKVIATSKNKWCIADPSDTLQITLYAPPVADFTFVQNESEVTFTNASADATSYVWDFGDGSSDNTENPVHTYTATGNYSVILAASNEYCIADTDTQEVSIIIIGVDPVNAEQLFIYPNPSHGKVWIYGSIKDKLTVNIYDMSGLQIINTELYEPCILDLKDFRPGTYIIQLYNGEQIIHHKLIVN